jgi:hypothetical protein
MGLRTSMEDPLVGASLIPNIVVHFACAFAGVGVRYAEKR